MELTALKIIDWEVATELAGGKKEFAEELLTMLLKDLPGDIAQIQQLYTEKNYPHLLSQVHRLHGALCYCGLLRLKKLIAHIETELKSNKIQTLPTLIEQLHTEVDLVFNHKEEGQLNAS